MGRKPIIKCSQGNDFIALIAKDRLLAYSVAVQKVASQVGLTRDILEHSFGITWSTFTREVLKPLGRTEGDFNRDVAEIACRVNIPPERIVMVLMDIAENAEDAADRLKASQILIQFKDKQMGWTAAMKSGGPDVEDEISKVDQDLANKMLKGEVE